MRVLTEHKINDCNNAIDIDVMDEPTPADKGGACHKYRLCLIVPDQDASVSMIQFQKGAVKEVGNNGISNESLIVILIDRLEHFQAGGFACDDNRMALESLRAALYRLQARTRDRQKRGVEGLHKA